jgi:hypothetical protein
MAKACTLQVGEQQLLGQINAQYVRENHSIEKWAQSVGQLYMELLNQ